MSSTRTRIAPSPTGPLHVGTARTALFNYLFAKKNGGKFILRIEDTDIERSEKKYEAEIIDSFKWLGIDYDEGPDMQGDYGPYRQSERLATYKKYLEKLLADGNAFYCFHSEKELEAEREQQLTSKTPPVHFCEYRDIAEADADKLMREKPEHIIRFKTQQGKAIKFSDTIRGEIIFESDLLGDFSLAKDLDVPLYNFAVVIDDFEMKISHVIRGEDHIPNTPKHILIQEALGLNRPEYAHLPLILGQDRSKLSKRHGATSISEYKAEGYLPEALINFMALLGWNPGGEREIFSMKELIDNFDIDKVQKSGAVFNIEKLDWMNGEYIRKKSVEDLSEIVHKYDFLPGFSVADIVSTIKLEQPRLKKLSEIKNSTYIGQEPEYEAELLRWKNMSDDEAKKSLNKSVEIVSGISGNDFTGKKLASIFFNEIGAGDKGGLLWPLRVALSGKKASPGPFDLMEALGKNKTILRINKALGLLQN